MKTYKIGDEFKTKCLSINNYGNGVSKIDGLLVFIPNFYPDEEAIISLTEVHKNYAFASIKELLVRSPYRVKSVCDHSSDSGSCPFSDISLEYENKLKGEMVKNNVERALNTALNDLEVLYTEPTYGYRNKVTVFFNNKYQFGYFIEGTHKVCPIKSCVTISDEILKVLNSISILLKEYKVEIYNYKNQGIVKGVSIRRSSYNSKMSIMFLATKSTKELRKIADDLKELYSDITGISVSINNNDKTVVYSDNEVVLYGQTYIDEHILNMDYRVENQSFLQVNTNGASLLYSEAIKMAELSKEDTVLDLYSGAGGISLNVSPYVKEVIGIETVKSAVDSANINKYLNKVSNAEFYNTDSANMKSIIKDKTIDIVFTDPPRSGMESSVIADIIS
ncbi:MAG: 23S rRNA (uracil(1939)-C(5))-methyltransferase RlmD, partial [Gammaproteobacteria bacterium]|nr:23S rRNA (uracil(1939)-C(5))-methyltransferase RlmD [Gammaproteobacteria bacterium]